MTVTAQPECTWTATSEAPWITIVSSSSGQGGGTVDFRVAANSGSGARRGVIAVNNQRVNVDQVAPGACAFSIAPTSQAVTAAGGTGTVSVTTGSTCAWTATSSADWITIDSGATGSGNGSVGFTVAPNPGGGTRTGTLTIGGQAFTVTQSAAGNCAAIAPSSQSVGIAGGSGTVTVSAGSACQWTATSGAPWITITSGGSGTGNGAVGFNVAANPGAPRTGVLTIAGQTFTVTQSGTGPPPNCVYTLSQMNQSVPSTGGNGVPVRVTTSDECTWTTTSNVPWITNVAPKNGTGPGNVSFTVTANPGIQRIGTITIAGKTFTVTQADGCSFTLVPASNTNIPSSGGPFSIVATASDQSCPWTVNNGGLAWITITSPSQPNGTGNVTVNYTVAANNGLPRSGNMNIAGRTFAVAQADGCSFTLVPASNTNIPINGGPFSIVATASNQSCPWTVNNGGLGWITITSPSQPNGTGNVTVNYSVTANSGPARSGNMNIAGRTFAVAQADGCTFALNPTSQSVPKNPPPTPPFQVTVTTGGGCAWTVVNIPTWIHFTTTSGTGTATLPYTVDNNPNPTPRTATLTIGGQPFTVNQAG